MSIDRSQYLTPIEVGKALAVSANTVRRWCRTGLLQKRGVDVFELPGGHWLVHHDVLKTSPK
jgi:predicted site-specific integrase-resolvase